MELATLLMISIDDKNFNVVLAGIHVLQALLCNEYGMNSLIVNETV